MLEGYLDANMGLAMLIVIPISIIITEMNARTVLAVFATSWGLSRWSKLVQRKSWRSNVAIYFLEKTEFCLTVFIDWAGIRIISESSLFGTECPYVFVQRL